MLSPLVVLDLGSAVAGVTWSPYSSSVFVAVTDEGRVHVYDLFLRKCRPLCVQSLVQRRRVAATCVAFNPFHPIILVGGEKGHLIALKLSPNLRKPHKDAKGADAQQLQEIELCKMERLIATANKG
ncbi:Dynein intermediate chain 2 ciliary-like 2 [Homarus americanus]|uniref:Dynein intermediate chain 2 ciliary-like 2 n=1 Tax=Homarus americanus TaxID=6706 RepID=A0A8J5NA38_HOMAM|nr:Dynein intermediate chain 2 ciliary-like 2 [Homarus americanus]